MVDGGREMIPLESDQYKNDPVINQHIMQMIDTDLFWYGKTFRAILMKLQKIQNGEPTTKTGKELNEEETYCHNDSNTTFNDQRLYYGEEIPHDLEFTESIGDESKAQKDWPRKRFQMNKIEPNESAMMCWESLNDSEQASKKRKTHAQDKETNDKADEMDDKTHTKRTASMGIQLNIPVDALKLGANDDTSTLSTQETSAKYLVYITNILEGKLGTNKNVRDSSKNPGKQDDKNCSPLEKTDPVTSNDNLNAYGESDRVDNPEKGKECKKNIWRTRKIIHMEFESDDDVAEQSKNANDAKVYYEYLGRQTGYHQKCTRFQ